MAPNTILVGIGLQLTAAATILGAFFFEYVIGLTPCPLCLAQRVPYYMLMALGPFLILAAGKPRATPQINVHALPAQPGGRGAPLTQRFDQGALLTGGALFVLAGKTALAVFRLSTGLSGVRPSRAAERDRNRRPT